MGVMIIPFVSSLSDDVISAVPQSLREGSLGLGATPSETIRRVVVPAANKFVGFDASPELVAGLEKSHIHALVVQDPVAMGRRGVELLTAHLRGEDVPKTERTALVVATPDNHREAEVSALLRPDLSALNK